ncbi:MAG: glycoside hydrolase family 28 protein [Acidobacteria bacterium]|nr:glycoside hydrolase family 28 protein [Acidobacteriota bacterium]
MRILRILRIVGVVVTALFLNACRAPRTTYDITGYGALGDGQTVNTEAIQEAIDACALAGGGVVRVPRGTFLSGAVFFKTGVDLHIDEGGCLKGTTNMADYRLVQTRWEGEERIWVSALVNAFGIEGFTLDGGGTIDGSGDIWHRQRFGPGAESASGPSHVGPVREGPPPLGPGGGLDAAPDSPAYNFVETELPGYARPRLIAVQNCDNAAVRDIRIRNQSSWGVFVLYSRDVTIENLNIRAAHHIPSSDGIDIDSCDGVVIRNVDIDVNDDCIAIKSGKDEDGRRVGRPAENILITGSIFRYGHGGVSMGSEMSGGIRNVTIRDSVMMEDNWAPIRFKSQPSRGGVVENITYENIELRGTRKAFEFNMAWRMIDTRPAANPLPVVRGVRIANVSGTAASVGDMTGLDDSPITKVVFENCTIAAAESGFILRNVEDIDLSGLTIRVPEGVEPVIRR